MGELCHLAQAVQRPLPPPLVRLAPEVRMTEHPQLWGRPEPRHWGRGEPPSCSGGAPGCRRSGRRSGLRVQLVQGGRWGAVLTQGRRHFALAAARLEGHAQLGVERAAHLRRGNNQRVSSAEEAGAEAVEEVQVVGGGAARLRVARPLEGRAHVVRPHRLCATGPRVCVGGTSRPPSSGRPGCATQAGIPAAGPADAPPSGSRAPA